MAFVGFLDKANFLMFLAFNRFSTFLLPLLTPLTPSPLGTSTFPRLTTSNSLVKRGVGYVVFNIKINRAANLSKFLMNY